MLDKDPDASKTVAVSICQDKSSEAFDLITMGRVGVDLYPEQSGVPLEDVSSFRKMLGGSATNVAVAAARLGHRSAVVTRTGPDPFGRYVRAELRSLGVDPGYVDDVDGLLTPVTFCEIFPPDDFPLYFYRAPVAPDLMIAPEQLDLHAIGEARILWITATGLSREPSRSAHLAALEARSDGPGLTILDLDYRASFWPTRDEATARVTEALPFIDVAVGNLQECSVAVGEAPVEELAARLHDRGVSTAVVKQGPDGVYGSDGSGAVRVPPRLVDVVNGLGAGDAFGGALCHGLLENWGLAESLDLANRAGAHVATRLGCAEAMPTLAEIAEPRSTTRMEQT